MARKILIPVDGSENAQGAFDFYIANLMKADDEVLLLHVQQTPHLSVISLSEPLNMPTEEWTTKISDQVKKSQALIAHYEMLCESKKLKKHSLLDSGKPGEAICRAAKEKQVSMIVMGSRGLNAIRRTFVGSVSDYVLHHAHIPVTVVPHAEHQK